MQYKIYCTLYFIYISSVFISIIYVSFITHLYFIYISSIINDNTIWNTLQKLGGKNEYFEATIAESKTLFLIYLKNPINQERRAHIERVNEKSPWWWTWGHVPWLKQHSCHNQLWSSCTHFLNEFKYQITEFTTGVRSKSSIKQPLVWALHLQIWLHFSFF